AFGCAAHRWVRRRPASAQVAPAANLPMVLIDILNWARLFPVATHYQLRGDAVKSGFLGGVAGILAVFATGGAARADESPFSSIYTTELLPQSGSEAEQWLTWATSKPDERFDEVEGRTEVEYGITNRLQLSLYANYEWTKIVPKGPGALDDPTDTTRFTGFSGEAIYQVLNPFTDDFGFALYLEPAIGAGERALEAKLLFQK